MAKEKKSGMLTAEKYVDIHKKAIKNFDYIVSEQEDDRMLCLQDRRFCYVTGAQWEGEYGEQFINKPRMEFNKVQLSVIRILSEFMNNRIMVNYQDKGDNDGDLDDKLDGLFRSDWIASNGDEGGDNCVNEGSTGGIGGFKLTTTYDCDFDEDDERQRIVFEPIFDADSCLYFDRSSKRQDKRDAKYAFLLKAVSREDYKEMYDDDPTTWPKTVNETYFDWCDTDNVYLAEYYEIEEDEEKVYRYEGMDGNVEKYTDQDFKDNENLEQDLDDTGYNYIGEKMVKRRRVHKYIMSGAGVIEDCGYVPGKYIPLVIYYGKRIVVDGIERPQGHVRLGKDAQLLYNMQNSRLAEISATSVTSKPILTDEMINGYETMWERDNIDNYPALKINQPKDADGTPIPVQINYTKSPEIPPATAALIANTNTDIKELTGNQQAMEEVVANTSGEVYKAVQTNLDMQVFIYYANYKKSMKMCGDIYLEMAKEVYVEPDRKMRVIKEDGDSDYLVLNEPMIDDNGEVYMSNDLSKATMEVSASVGPSTSSKKEATVNNLINMIQYTSDPQDIAIITSMIIRNMEGEGIKGLQEYYRKKLVQAGVENPTEEDIQEALEAAQAQEGQVDPNTQLMQSAAMEAEANAQKAQADAMKSMKDAELKDAQTGKTKAETIETLSKIERDDIETADKILNNSINPATQQPNSNVGV